MRAMRVVPDQLVESNEPGTAVELHTEMDWRCADNKVLNFFIGDERNDRISSSAASADKIHAILKPSRCQKSIFLFYSG